MTPTGIEVERALVGWPRCHGCGNWMRITGRDGDFSWYCTHQLGVRRNVFVSIRRKRTGRWEFSEMQWGDGGEDTTEEVSPPRVLPERAIEMCCPDWQTLQRPCEISGRRRHETCPMWDPSEPPRLVNDD